MEEDGEDATASINSSASIVDPTADNEDGVVAGQGKQELVEAVLELGAQEDNQGEDVTNDADETKDGDKNSIKVISIVEEDGQVSHADYLQLIFLFYYFIVEVSKNYKRIRQKA